MAADPATESKTAGSAAAVFPRLEQTFPTLTPQEMARMRRFGDVRFYTAGERLMTAGQVAPGLLVVLAGSVAVTEHDHLDVHLPIVTYGEGDFMGELARRHIA